MSLERKIKLKQDEKIILTVRRYGLTFFWSWLVLLVLISGPFFFMFWLFRHGWWGQALFIIPLVLGLVLLFRILFIWKKNVLVLTTHRLVDIDQRGLFDKVVSNIPYDEIEDVVGRIKGVWGTIFRYGEVSVQTTGNVQIIVERVKQPVHLQEDINQLKKKYLSKYSHEFSGDVTEQILDKLYELEQGDLIRVKKVLEKRINKEIEG